MQLSGIFVYPIKSCGGVAVSECAVAPRGLALDRRYLLTDRAGSFVTQRDRHDLCRVKVELVGTELRVTAPGAPELFLPQQPAPAGLMAKPYRVWESQGSALLHPEGSRWFSEWLKDDISLLYMPDSEQRAVNPKRARPGDIVSFADGYPLLLVSEESLRDLSSRLGAPMDMRRFRPNLVITGCEPYAEDTFTTLRIADVGFRGVKRCDRCVVTTLDPDTGAPGKEPLRTLAKYRLSEGKVWFGMNLIHDGPGTLRVGDEAHSP